MSVAMKEAKIIYRSITYIGLVYVLKVGGSYTDKVELRPENRPIAEKVRA